MTAPIPISSSPDPQPQHSAAPPSSAPIPQGHVNHTPNPSGSSTSTLSSSPGGPQTPFSPALTFSSASPPQNPNSSILKWASSFGSLGKSPTFQGGSPVPPRGQAPGDEHEHEHEHHDVFEFGDISDLHRSSWTGHGRRAASMSQASGVGMAKSPPVQGGISAMLAGMGRDGGTGGGGGTGGTGGTGGGGMNAPLGSPPLVGGGVIAENAAKGQGLLRRLSLGGAGRGRPPMLSPTQTPSTFIPSSAPAQPGITSTTATSTQPASILSAQAPAPAPADKGLLSPANGGTTSSQRGRRYSENQQGKKRGVSPMGERILRDHGHF